DLNVIEQKGERTADYSSIERTKQFSQGAVTIAFAISDGNKYKDTTKIVIPLTKQPGMEHRIGTAHTTCLKQIDSKNAWAGIGYWTTLHDPETQKDTIFKITQFVRRASLPDGTSRWNYPQDIEVPEIPFY